MLYYRFTYTMHHIAKPFIVTLSYCSGRNVLSQILRAIDHIRLTSVIRLLPFFFNFVIRFFVHAVGLPSNPLYKVNNPDLWTSWHQEIPRTNILNTNILRHPSLVLFVQRYHRPHSCWCTAVASTPSPSFRPKRPLFSITTFLFVPGSCRYTIVHLRSQHRSFSSPIVRFTRTKAAVSAVSSIANLKRFSRLLYMERSSLV